LGDVRRDVIRGLRWGIVLKNYIEENRRDSVVIMYPVMCARHNLRRMMSKPWNEVVTKGFIANQVGCMSVILSLGVESDEYIEFTNVSDDGTTHHGLTRKAEVCNGFTTEDVYLYCFWRFFSDKCGMEILDSNRVIRMLEFERCISEIELICARQDEALAEKRRQELVLLHKLFELVQK
jgi:hypothetical protein